LLDDELQTPKGNGGHSDYLVCTTYFQANDDDDDDWSIRFSPCTADFRA
jgi:hypothetical protein